MNLSNRWIVRVWRRLLGHERGVALIEFALVFPFFFLLLFGGLEINRLMLIQQKLEKSGYALADIVTQYIPATPAGATGEIKQSELDNNVYPQLTRTMRPFDDSARQAVIITSVMLSPTTKTTIIKWQSAGGGSLSGCDSQPTPTCVKSIVNGLAPSAISPSVAGQATSFPSEENGFIRAIPISSTDVNVVVLEAFYLYQPYLQQLLQGVGTAGGSGFAGFNFYLKPQIFVKRTYFIPRSGPLFALPPKFPAS